MTAPADTTATDQRVALMTAPAWRPEPGESITGTVARLSARETEYGKHLVVTLDTGNGAYTAVHCFHSVLKNAMYDLKPTNGDDVTVYYHGKVDREDKPSYHSYTVLDPNAPAETEFSWAEVAADEPGF